MQLMLHGCSMADIIAETDRLILRAIEEGDAERQYQMLNSPVLMERLGGPKQLHEIEDKHAASMALYAREGFSFLMMIEKGSGELVGHCGLKRVDNPLALTQGDHEVGWLVREDRWRRGYATEAVTAVLDWAFGPRIEAPYLVALTSMANIASWKFMQQLGMQRREELDFDDPAYPPQDRTTIVYSLTASQWQETRK